jgi:hypothetical protein
MNKGILMNETKVLNEFFIWEEKNSTEPTPKSVNNGVNDHKDIINETKTNSMPNDWKDITDPKLKQKARMKAWRDSNRDKIKSYNDMTKDKRKVYYESNKDRIRAKQKVYNNINRDKIKDQNKTYYESNKEKIKSHTKLYRELNPEETKIRNKKYYENNKNTILKRSKDYYSFNKEYDKVYNKINKKKRNDYKSSYRKNNIQYKLSSNLRSRLKSAIKCNYKSGSAVKDLGCSIDELKTYLESKFSPGMTWDNWSLDGWHIDHIKPLASFDLTDRKQLLEACHYTNLQPLWASDNLTKSDKII